MNTNIHKIRENYEEYEKALEAICLQDAKRIPAKIVSGVFLSDI